MQLGRILTNSLHYIDRAVEKILDTTGRVVNSYKYDIFGKMTYQAERIRNIFKYSGLYGVMHDEELVGIYMMRARHYDSQHGRFISLDPSGKQISGFKGAIASNYFNKYHFIPKREDE